MHKPLSAILLVLAACSSDDSSPADVSGTYSVAVTNTDNGCNYPNWMIGQSAQNIPFAITQSGAEATGNLQGLANIYFVALGIGALNGPVTGSSASITATGTKTFTQATCTYSVSATADFTLTGNTINGTMTYRNQTNGSADCGSLAACSSQQTLAGSRPPK